MSAVAVALAAALAAMAARFSRGRIDGADAIAAEADGLRARLLELAQADVDSYAAVLAAQRRPRDDPARADAVAEALAGAADAPLAIAEAAADVGELAARVADAGNPNLLGDAAAATCLAEAGARACATLVRINLRGTDDPRIVRAAAAVERASGSTREV